MAVLTSACKLKIEAGVAVVFAAVIIAGPKAARMLQSNGDELRLTAILLVLYITVCNAPMDHPTPSHVP